MALETVILYLLRHSGYQPAAATPHDSVLRLGRSGYILQGRGTEHQIDAIGDCSFTHPFSYPQRLLIEAKMYNPTPTKPKPVPIDVVRNAYGVLRDVSEFWDGRSQNPINRKSRFHYQYAIFSATGFTSGAEQYGFAQDIFCFSLNLAGFLSPILNAIRADSSQLAGRRDLGKLRILLRDALLSGRTDDQYANDLFPRTINACGSIQAGFIGNLQGQFPIFLIPNPEYCQEGNTRQLRALLRETRSTIRIRWDDNGWYIDDTLNNRLFTFALPEQLLNEYARDGELPPNAAVDLKEAHMGSISILMTSQNGLESLSLWIDNDWIQEVRRGLENNQGR